MGDDRDRRCLIPHPTLRDEFGNVIWLEGIGSECNSPDSQPIDSDPPPAQEENAGTLGAPSPPTSPPSLTDPDSSRPGDVVTDVGSTTGTAPPTTASVPPPTSGVASDTRPPGSGDTDTRPLAQQFYDPLSDLRDYDLIDRIAELGIPPDKREEAVQAILHNEPPLGLPHPFFGLDNRPILNQLADPVLIFTGQYSLIVTDVEVPSRGFPMRLTRSYRSGEVYFGPWGFNWDHNYNVYLRELVDGSVAVWTGLLNEDVYRPTPNGEFEPPIGVFRRLQVEVASGTAPGRFLLTDRHGNRQVFMRPPDWPFSDRMPLVALEDRHNNRHELTYNSDGRLDRVSDHASRFLRFFYGDCGLLEAVEDHIGRRWRYEHDSEAEHLTAVTMPPTSEYPNSLVTRYQYASDRAHPALIHNLVQVIDPAGQLVIENQYGEDPSSPNFGRVVGQQFGDFVTLFDATQLQFPPRDPSAINAPTWRIEVVDPGVLHVYTFNYRGDLLDHRYRLILDGSARVVAQINRYDSQGNLVERWEPNGHGTLLRYDHENPDPRARGNLVRVERVAPPSFSADSRVVQACTYEPTFHRLKSCADEGGSLTTLVYDFETLSGDRGDVVRIEFPTVTLPDGTAQPRVEQFRLNEFGQLVERVTGAGHRHHFTYIASGTSIGYLESIVLDVDGVAHSRTFEYDSAGNITAFIDGIGRRVERTFNALNQITSFRPPPIGGFADETRYFYSPSGKLRRVEEPRGDYSDPIIAESFIASEYEYNALGHLVVARRFINTASPRVTRYMRDAEGRPVTVIDPSGRITRNVFDERSCLLYRTEAVGLPEEATWHYTYDRNGNLTSLTDPSGYHYEHAYDPWDRLTRISLPGTSDAERTRIQLRANRFDQTDEVTITGLVTPGVVGTLFHATSEYDNRGRLTRRHVGNRFTICTYDGDERLVMKRDSRGNTVHFVFDGLNRVVEYQDQVGNRELRNFSPDGTLESLERHEVSAAGTEIVVTRFEYDERRRPRAVVDPLGRRVSMGYDARNLMVEHIDSLGQRSRFSFSVVGELTALILESTPGHEIVHGFSFDDVGRQVGYRDPLGRLTRYGYDARNRRIATTYPDGRVHKYFYDSHLQLGREETPGGTTIQYRYGSDGGLSRVEFTPGVGIASTPPIDIVNDGMRRQIRLAQGGSIVIRAYDDQSRLTEDTFAGRTTRVNYADNEGVIRRTFSDGRIDRIDLDALGRPTSLSLEHAGIQGLPLGVPEGTQLATWEWRGRSRISRRTLHCGAISETEYDKAGNLTSLASVASGGIELVTLRYVHDAAGRRRLVWSSPSPHSPTRCDFDGLTRLTGVTSELNVADPGPTLDAAGADAAIAAVESVTSTNRETYVLDDADHRLELISTGTPAARHDVFTVEPAGQIRRLQRSGTSAGSFLFEFDNDGRCVTDDRHRYVWDALSRLVEVRSITTNSLEVSQEFDPLGRVIRRTDAGLVTEYEHYNLRVVGWRNADSGTVTQVTHGVVLDEIIVESDTDSNRWAIQDPSATVLAWLDDAAAVRERYHYSAFGETQIFAPDGITPRPASTIGASPIFAGYSALHNDLYAARARIYDPRLGRFLSRDVAGYVDGSNLYAYVHNDPIHWVDPTGEIGFFFTGLIIAGIGFVAGAAIDAVHQEIEIAEGSREEFDWGEVLTSGAKGAVIAPVITLVPEVGVLLAGYGAYNGIEEIRDGHPYSGAFDIGLSLLPFLSRGVRTASFGQGSVVGRVRGLGPVDPLSVRVSRLTSVGKEFAHRESTITRVTHLTTEANIRSIETSGTLLNEIGSQGPKELIEGAGDGAWVSPWRATELGRWRRSMIGYPFRPKNYVEFDVRPGELTRPGGIKWGFSRWQRQILLEGERNLDGRNPTFGVLPGNTGLGPGVLWPWTHLPPLIHSGVPDTAGQPPHQSGSLGAALAPQTGGSTLASK